MAAEMSTAEREAFLDEMPARTAVLAVTRKDGRPIGVPIWYVRNGDELVFTTWHESLKGQAMRRDPRIALTVQDPRPPFSYVIAEGEVRWSEDSDDLLHWATVIGGRYMGEDGAEQYGKRNAVPGELLLRVRPTRWQALRHRFLTAGRST
jgi:PPOX class probable F420-dependent enzyme